MNSFQGIPSALRWLRLQKRRKQREVAQRAGITQGMLCAYEQGKREPSLASLGKVLDALDVDLHDLADALGKARGPSAGAQAVGSARVTGSADPAPEQPPSQRVDLAHLLGGPLRASGEERAALEQIFDGFCRCLSLLDAAILDLQGLKNLDARSPPE
jgi:transcriptional regulator with XRE-family HTH domain